MTLIIVLSPHTYLHDEAIIKNPVFLKFTEYSYLQFCNDSLNHFF